MHLELLLYIIGPTQLGPGPIAQTCRAKLGPIDLLGPNEPRSKKQQMLGLRHVWPKTDPDHNLSDTYLT